MAPIESVTSADFEKTAPYTPDRQLTDAAHDLVTFSLSVEGLGGISDYSVRVELPAFEDNLRAVAQIVYQVHAAMFAVNWGPDADDEGGG